jgi:hypothetical protein
LKPTSTWRSGLVDDASEAFHDGNADFAHNALLEAQKVLTDIEVRLAGLDPGSTAAFGPLVEELRKAIRAAESQFE